MSQIPSFVGQNQPNAPKPRGPQQAGQPAFLQRPDARLQGVQRAAQAIAGNPANPSPFSGSPLAAALASFSGNAPVERGNPPAFLNPPSLPANLPSGVSLPPQILERLQGFDRPVFLRG